MHWASYFFHVTPNLSNYRSEWKTWFFFKMLTLWARLLGSQLMCQVQTFCTITLTVRFYVLQF